MSDKKASIGMIVLEAAVAAFLIVNGIVLLQNSNGGIAEIARMFGDTKPVIASILGVCEIIAGAILVLHLCGVSIPAQGLLLLIVIVIWAVHIVVMDLFGGGGLFNGALKNSKAFFAFLRAFVADAVILGALLVVKE